MQDGTVLRDPHERCPQATVQAVALVSAEVLSSGMPRLRCEQAMPECRVHRPGCERRLGEASDDGVSETRALVRSRAMRLHVVSAGHGAGQRRSWRRRGGFSS
ncbi:hypothetical protein NDU88_006567 [Pleurodeles waltl]|uniref:Uncharacterized protein n=1 Tax=Pleurodeles waltl TaxID=8319 RepID=A0AAV7L7Z8_PLEWA|nr:hypothetical protein NDU88_006567 [Pleurodeles waltl]